MNGALNVRPVPVEPSSAAASLASSVPSAYRAKPSSVPSSQTSHPSIASPTSFASLSSTRNVPIEQDSASVPPSRPTPTQAGQVTQPTAATTTRDVVAASAEEPQPRVFSVEDDERLTLVQHMTAGALAGMTEHMAMYPVDTIKTRMQSYVALRDFSNLGMLNTTRSIIASEGVPALWRGVGAVAVSAGPAHALYFATYEAVRDALAPTQKLDGDVHPIATAAAGACATVVGDGVMTPLDVVKQRMQLCGRDTYRSVWHCTRCVYTHHGWRAFFAGYKATLLMNVPFTAVYFSGYETAKKLILEWRGISDSDFSATSHCVAGAAAGAAAAAATNPLDVVKTRLQTQGELGARRYRGLTDALRSIKAEEGYRGLMRGVRPRVLFHMPAAAVCWTTYEFCKHIMHRVGMDEEGGAVLK